MRLIFAYLLAIFLSSCDRTHEYYYEISNKTEDSLKIHFKNRIPDYDTVDIKFDLPPNSDSVVIYIARAHGAEGANPSDNPRCFDVKTLEIFRKDSAIIDLSKKDYWTFTKINIDTAKTIGQGLYHLNINSKVLRKK